MNAGVSLLAASSASLVLTHGIRVPCWPRALESGVYARSLFQLHGDTDNNLVRSFSEMKFGSVRQIALFGRLMAMAVEDTVGSDFLEDRQNWVVTTPPAGTLPRAIELVADTVAGELGLERLTLHKVDRKKSSTAGVQPYSALGTAQDRRARRIQQGFVTADIGPLGDRNVILMDDVMTTGTTLAELSHHMRRDRQARRVRSFAILSIESPNAGLEEIITNRFIEAEGLVSGLARLFQDENTLVTRRTLRALFDGGEDVFEDFFDHCPNGACLSIAKAAQIYYGTVENDAIQGRLEGLRTYLGRRGIRLDPVRPPDSPLCQ